MNYKKYQLFLPKFADVNYETASDIIIEKAVKSESFGVSALAVHGLVTSLTDKSLGKVINDIDLLVPDGQPVKWALNSFHKLGMKDTVSGPMLLNYVFDKANNLGLGIYLYGSTLETLEKLQAKITKYYSSIKVCGIHPDRFKEATEEEDLEDIKKINSSGAHIVLVGRGCPRQEFWVANHLGKINAVMIAIGAAFDFHAGTLMRAPKWIQKSGLEWLFRLIVEPKRLWKRYLVTNCIFIYKFLQYKFIQKRT